MAHTDNTVRSLVDRIKRRWRRRALIQGGVVSLLTMLGLGSLLLFLRLVAGLSGNLLGAGVAVSALALLAVVVQQIIRPAWKRVSDRQIALYIEEQVPELEDRFNSAIEVDELDLSDEHRGLVDQLIDDAARRAEGISISRVVGRGQVRMLAYAAGVAGLVFIGLGYLALSDLTTAGAPGTPSMLVADAPGPMTVAPGDVEIEQGGRQEVTVRLREESGQDVVLYHRQGEGEWTKTVMERGEDQHVYRHTFADVQEPIQYFAEHGQDRSDPYTIALYAFPQVQRIDATYRYPEYTGEPPQTKEDVGDLRGLKGSTVTVDVSTSGSVEQAELVLNEERRVALTPGGDGTFSGAIALQEPGSYRVELIDGAGKQNKFPESYQIEPVPDETPRIRVTDPKRDVRANAVEEVLVATEVEDDYGLKAAQLTYSVNGSEEQSISLLGQGGERPRQVDGAHRFFLEELNLQPGDIISYYVEAEDYAPEASSEATDMYFIEVIPFDQNFSQVNNQGGGQQGGGQQSGTVLNQQQIINATWKLRRQRFDLPEDEFEQSRQAVEKAQANLKANIEERINNTAFAVELRTDRKSQQVVEHLRAAVQHMEAALEHLRPGRLDEALTPERKALNRLLRAEALNKERQVAINRQRSSRGGGAATEERMTELMDLELDISEDKYETQQQSSGTPQQRQVDEALQKVRELAKKQEELMRQQNERSVEGEDKKRSIDRLRRDQEQLQEQADQLAQAMRRQSQSNERFSRRTEEQVRRASENMRRAERALQRGDTQEAMTRQQQALRELNRLREELQLARKNDTREMVDELARDLEQLKEKEQQMSESLQRAREEAQLQGQASSEALEQLRASQQEMQERAEQLESKARVVREQAEGEEAEVAQAAEDLVQRMQDQNLREQIQQARRALEGGNLDEAAEREEELRAGLQQLGDAMQNLQDQTPLSEQDQLAQTLQQVEDIRRQLEQLQNEAQQARQGQQQSRQQGRSGTGQLQRRLEDTRQALNRLQQNLEGNPQAQRRVRELQKALRADHTGVLLEGEAAKAYMEEKVYNSLSELELELAQQLDGVYLRDKLYGAGQEGVPASYRELVEKYYESLSKTK